MTTEVRFPYQKHRDDVFTTNAGIEALAWSSYVSSSMGTFTMTEFAMKLGRYTSTCDTWKVLNLLDYLVEIGVLRELTGPETPGQNRCFQFAAR